MNISPDAPTKRRSNAAEPLRGSTFDRRLLWKIAIGFLWVSASCGGLAVLAMYANSPGPSSAGPRQWPSDSSLQLNEQGSTLILFAHPRCPCTRATLGELEKIVARFQDSVTPWVVFYKPAGSDDRWDQTDLRATAAAIPGVHVVSDPGGIETRRFGANTSGETLLYNNQGELLFNGGITRARGHAGDNDGRSAIESSLSGVAPSCSQTPAFGCPIAHSLPPAGEVQ
ncbi:thioredoxin domain-containing protein [Lignipirellula cremea]|uniref:RedB protein n=1 Tax=Lignipirellula cremea TaxID=2528010 RepID=A0A518E4X9_9BACT|nr:RedB protein [Lignipirellula cremea]QDU99134.1 hypothetical protein Pla8534_70450 [Lignipirellula cremea]